MIGIYLGWMAACGPNPDAVLTGLGSENPVIREDMAVIARRAGTDEVLQALLGALEDTVEEVQVRAVESLGILQDSRAVEPLLGALGRSDGGMQRSIIDALGQIGDIRAVESLVALVEATETIPLNAVWALGELGDARAMALLSRLRSHADPFVSWNAERALEKLPARNPAD